MVFRQGYRRVKHETECKCGHPQVCHYTKDGACVYQACDCKQFSPKGRPEYRNRRGTCQYNHHHDSGTEIRECFDLHVRKQAGDIRDFQFHRVVELFGPSGAVVATFETDFIVEFNDGTIEIVECKGKHLAMEQGFRLKWALLQDKHKGDKKYRFRMRVE